MEWATNYKDWASSINPEMLKAMKEFCDKWTGKYLYGLDYEPGATAMPEPKPMSHFGPPDTSNGVINGNE